jgi:nucleoid-associated protein YgaU
MKMIRFRGIFSRKKKLRATTRRATASGANFDDLSEPNMKLSRALLIVLLLHVVAVAGIIAFNAIKSRQGAIAVVSSSHVTKAATNHEDAKATPSSPAKPAKKAKTSESIPEGGKVYIVAKGDNPVTIAKKFKVPYDDLLAANHIDDPHKLKIGQKLIIPPKAAKGKKANE